MKKHLLIVIVLFLNIFLFAQNKGVRVDLQVGEEDLFIEFIDEKTYTFYSPIKSQRASRLSISIN